MAGANGVWLERRVLSYAHRGGAFEAPASTPYAIERAVALGVTGIELDVHASSDGVVVVSHDATVDASTNGSGPIASMTFDDLARLDHGYWFLDGRGDDHETDAARPFRGLGPTDRRFAIATLDEALEAAAGTVVNLDIKQGAPEVPDYVAKVAEAIARHGIDGEVIVTSFDDRRTAAFSALAPDVATSPGVGGLATFVQAVRAGEPPPALGGNHVALQVPATFAGAALVDERFVATAHRAGLAVHVWTINEATEMQRLIELGVDAIMSDVPSVLVDVTRAAGVDYRR